MPESEYKVSALKYMLSERRHTNKQYNAHNISFIKMAQHSYWLSTSLTVKNLSFSEFDSVNFILMQPG